MTTQTYDFNDGKGPVPAHQHKKGNGWVANSANVSDRVYVGHSATITGGNFYGGVFYGGIFHSGVFYGGVFHSGVFRGGVFRGGVFHDGIFRGGVFHDGIFRGGVFYGGVFHDGIFRGGNFHGGNFQVSWQKHYINACAPGEFQVGCKRATTDWWLSKGRAAVIKEGYTEEQAEILIQLIRIGAKCPGVSEKP